MRVGVEGIRRTGRVFSRPLVDGHPNTPVRKRERITGLLLYIGRVASSVFRPDNDQIWRWRKDNRCVEEPTFARCKYNSRTVKQNGHRHPGGIRSANK